MPFNPSTVYQGNNKVLTGAGTNASANVQPSAISSSTPQNDITTAIPSNDFQQQEYQNNTYNSADIGGEDLYMALAKLAPFEYFKGITMDTGETLKICCYITDKFNFRRESSIFFKYGQEVKNITIENSIHSFGTTASVIISDSGGSMSSILEGQLNFYFVISIFNSFDVKEGESGSIEEGIIYQPYVFEIENVQLISPDNSADKIYKITLSDIISSTLKRVSYGNLLLEQPAFPNLPNFKEVYNAIIDYAATVINLSHDKKYRISNELILGGSIDDQINPIIKDILLKDITIDVSLYTLLQRIYKIAARELEVPVNYAKKAEVKGMVLTPLFLRDEWEDLEGYYRTYYNDHDSDDVSENLTYKDENKLVVNGTVFKRNLYLKHLQMPFQLAFCEKEPRIYETFNPKMNRDGTIHGDELLFNPLNGYSVSILNDVVELPIDGEMAASLWKNIALMSDGCSGSANALIYYNWIFEYYKNAYLNYEENFIKKHFNKETMPPVDPYFHRLEQLNLVGGDKEKFAKINSVTSRLRSSDPIKEAFWHVGRAVKSYVFLNSLFGFKVKGNIIRHPGEIIKINYGAGEQNIEMTSSSAAIGGLSTLDNGYVMAYVTQVIHEFKGTEYSDIIHATKICSVSDPAEEIIKNEGAE